MQAEEELVEAVDVFVSPVLMQAAMMNVNAAALSPPLIHSFLEIVTEALFVDMVLVNKWSPEGLDLKPDSLGHHRGLAQEISKARLKELNLLRRLRQSSQLALYC